MATKPAPKTATKTTPKTEPSPILTLERLKELQDLSLSDALALAQSEMTNPAKNSTGKMPTKAGFYEFKFAGFDVISTEVRRACNRWGILVTQPITSEWVDGKLVEYVHTVARKGNEYLELAKMKLPSDYRDVKTRGGDISYFQRQEAKAAFVLAGDDDVSDQSGDFTPDIDKNYQPSKPVTDQDKEDAKREQDNILDDKLLELEDRRKVAKSLGLSQDGYMGWIKANIGKPQSSWHIKEFDDVIGFLNRTINDFAALKTDGEESMSY